MARVPVYGSELPVFEVSQTQDGTVRSVERHFETTVSVALNASGKRGDSASGFETPVCSAGISDRETSGMDGSQKQNRFSVRRHGSGSRDRCRLQIGPSIPVLRSLSDGCAGALAVFEIPRSIPGSVSHQRGGDRDS